MKKALCFLAALLISGMLFSCATTGNTEQKDDECILRGYIKYLYSTDGKNYTGGPWVMTINDSIKVNVKSDGTFTFKGKLNKCYSITGVSTINSNGGVMIHDMNYFTSSKEGIMCDVVYTYDGSTLASYVDGKIGVFYKKKFEDTTGFGSKEVDKKLDNKIKISDVVIPNVTTEAERKKNPKLWVANSVENINNHSQNDFEKVLYACKLIALNIDYDNKTYEKTKSYQSYRLNIDDANRILKKGTGMCYEYAIVLKEFCDELNIPCLVVGGKSKGDSKKNISWDKVNFSELGNHAWNVVIIDGIKYYVDLTWADSDGKTNQLDYKWIFPDPAEFRKTHRSYSPDY